MGAEQSTESEAQDVSAAPSTNNSIAETGEAVTAAVNSAAIPSPSEPLVETLSPEAVVQKLNEAALSNPDINQETIEACCKRVRVLCRETEQCKECDQHGAAAAVVNAMKALPNDMSVQLQGLAAIVNLCSGETNAHRTKAVQAGALAQIVSSMERLVANAEVQEMGCIALQNCCYGEDELAGQRRLQAAEEGAMKAVVGAMKHHSAIPAAQEVGVATLRLIVHKMAELRKRAVEEAGAHPEWVKPIAKEGGGILSFRKGFGTSRSKAKKASN